MLCKELSDAAEGKGEWLRPVQLEMNMNAQLEIFNYIEKYFRKWLSLDISKNICSEK